MSASNSGIRAVLAYAPYVKAHVDVFIGRSSMNLDGAPDNPRRLRQYAAEPCRVAVAVAEGYAGSRHSRENEKPS